MLRSHLVACLATAAVFATAVTQPAGAREALRPGAQAAEPWRVLAEGQFDPAATARLRANGYVIAPAKVVWYSVESPPPDRPSAQGGLYVNNPLTIYGGVEIPRSGSGPGDGPSDIFQMDGDAAFALFGTTPPAITYYSFTMNEFARSRPDTGSYVQTNSSIGLSVNNENIGTAQGKMFEDNFVLIVAAQFSAAQQARDFFLKHGVPAHSINTMLVPHRFTVQSSERPPFLGLLSRLTFRTRAEEKTVTGYIKGVRPSLKALYFKGPGAVGDVVDGDLAQWEELLRDDDSEFVGSAPAELNLLSSRVIAYYANRGFHVQREGLERFNHIEPNSDCRDALIACNFDAPDALYGSFFCGQAAAGSADPSRCTGVLPNTNSRAVIVGVNHHNFGQDELMTYFSYAVTRLSDLQGVATLPDMAIEGSAAPFLPDLPNADDYFVITVARDCGRERHCLEVPYDDESGTPGLPKFGPVVITTRVYLDKIMGTAPNPQNFLPAKLYWLTR